MRRWEDNIRMDLKEMGINTRNWIDSTQDRDYRRTLVNSTPTKPVDNVVIVTKGLQDRNTNIIAGTTVENKGKLILTEIFPSVQKHDIF